MKSVDKQKGFLIDTTKCMGCRGCQVACKQWNELPAEKTKFVSGGPGSYQNPSNMSGKTYTIIKFFEIKDDKNNLTNWIFRKDQCQHCLEPACESACIVSAIKKQPEGPVTWDGSKCIGCRYCMVACPYNIPKFEWDKAVPDIRKCTLCYDRILEGLAPACATTCPTGAILFGDRAELIKVGEKRMKSNPDLYHQHLYGKEEVGGTCVMYLGKVPLEQLDYPKNLPTQPLGMKTAPAMHAIPGVVMGLSAVLGITSYIINRRIENQELEKKEGK
jgi:formate dehydrogenase iron-sulfur subunit